MTASALISTVVCAAGAVTSRGGRWAGAAAGAGAALCAGALLLRGALRRARGPKGTTRRRWEYGSGEFKLRRLLERRRFTRVQSDDSDDEPAPMLPPHHATA
ncbi:uncharacterized protein LOC114247466 [Bombyx mandarina]|uniref:Uncharacterized protein LOC114247466 n=1 Tax=Bombyx mandarina TaxID=7092 RepID=A0A6J2K5H8_BOMMA|nr:uncharacterized protein LOC114247466 [Bombyx mandarina]